ncbi:acetate--CoA ligase family protein [Comamonas endophytica]|uniref:Acetate--CoA ligase family protein n=1 Tax=Comamonas endophytica TaxID=2949090 RepID=A0ABY6GEX6_9BURK|nr:MULTISPECIES: acetate--CoA ligase family protein [unclassified Acidovorax]MCD2513232.1 acetate--CoA ligase family protein [Acidovorax sp. D4N7]UYG53423.1 acetate--CoA ligase family protein [Acidovorax sp. 5MLIR]
MTDLLQTALDPRSVAIVGASDNIHKIGGRPIYYMQKYGFQGSIYPINPNRPEIQGRTAYATLADLPEVPELALVVVSGEQAVRTVEECAARGVKSAVIIASGFGETGEQGKELERHMLGVARGAGMRLYGPNTQGLANFGTGAIAGFSTMFLEVPPMDGPIGIVSQSGGMSAMSYGLLRGRGLGVRHVHATGNEADVTVGELALAVAHDPDVKLLLLYLENIARPELLARAAAVARERDVPIIAIKAGRTAGGQRAASSHTGSLANEDRTVDAFFRHHGIWRVRDPHEQARAAQAYLKGWRPEGRRLVVISNSGASCVMGADAADDVRLPLAELSPATQQAVAAKLPGFATTHNPIDITAALLSNSGLFSDVLPAVASDPAADMFFINIPVAGAGYDVEQFARDTAAFELAAGKPVAVAAWQESVAAAFHAQSVATFPNEGDALGVLAQVADHTALMRRPRAQAGDLAAVELPADAGDGFLNEAQSLELLARHGVPTIGMRLCKSAEEAREAFDAIGGPVVVKACSAEVPHKSEHGLVALDVASREQAGELFTQFWRKMDSMQVARDGVIVAAMHRGQHEFMIGARWDPVFGPVVVVGDGGKYVEALKDCAVLLPPFSAQEVQQALRGLRIAPLLEGVRGDPALDVAALSEMAVAVGNVIAGARGRIASLDLNPVMVGARGKGALVVDALVELGSGAE